MESEEKLLDKAIAYVKAIKHINPAVVILWRIGTSEATKGGIIKPKSYHEKETRSSIWGQVLKVSSCNSTEDDEGTARKHRLNEGDYVLFDVTAPVRGGHPELDQCQIIGIKDVLLGLSSDKFADLIKSHI